MLTQIATFSHPLNLYLFSAFSDSNFLLLSLLPQSFLQFLLIWLRFPLDCQSRGAVPVRTEER